MRRRLREQRQMREALLLDLGALVFELHRHGRREPELLQAKAAELTAIDDEVRALSEALDADSTVLELVSTGIAGSCQHCGTLLATSARFCPTCGAASVPALDSERAPAAGIASSNGEDGGWPEAAPEAEAVQPEPSTEEQAALAAGEVEAVDPEPEPEPQAEAVAEPEPQAEPEPEALAEPEPEALAEPDAVEEPEAVGEAAAEPDAEEESEAVAEPEPAPEPAPEAEPEPAVAVSRAHATHADEPAAEAEPPEAAMVEPAEAAATEPEAEQPEQPDLRDPEAPEAEQPEVLAPQTPEPAPPGPRTDQHRPAIQDDALNKAARAVRVGLTRGRRWVADRRSK